MQYSDQYVAENTDDGPKKVLQKRLVLDYLSGMMDEYVKTTYNRLNNNNLKNI